MNILSKIWYLLKGYKTVAFALINVALALTSYASSNESVIKLFTTDPKVVTAWMAIAGALNVILRTLTDTSVFTRYPANAPTEPVQDVTGATNEPMSNIGN